MTAISTDGYDGTGQTTFTTAEASAEKLETYIREHLGGQVDMVFGESFGCATAGMLFHRKKVTVGSLIMSGPQYMNIGILSGLMSAIIPRNQYRLLYSIQERKKLPWLLKLYTRTDDEKLLNQFRNVPPDISIDTLQNCTQESLALYEQIDRFELEPEARVSIWYGAKEPNMKKAIQKLKHILITHQDTDHVGALERDSELLFKDATIYLSEIENRYLTGEVRRKVFHGLYKLPLVKTDNRKTLLQDGQNLDIDGIKIECILVPGHTWGHMVYLIDDEYLFIGDTLWFGADGGYSFISTLAEDNKLSVRSLETLENNLKKRPQAIKIITGHTGWTDDLTAPKTIRGRVMLTSTLFPCRGVAGNSTFLLTASSWRII